MVEIRRAELRQKLVLLEKQRQVLLEKQERIREIPPPNRRGKDVLILYYITIAFGKNSPSFYIESINPLAYSFIALFIIPSSTHSWKRLQLSNSTYAIKDKDL